MYGFTLSNNKKTGYGESSYDAMVNAVGKIKADLILDNAKNTIWGDDGIGRLYCKNGNIAGILVRLGNKKFEVGV